MKEYYVPDQIIAISITPSHAAVTPLGNAGYFPLKQVSLKDSDVLGTGKSKFLINWLTN